MATQRQIEAVRRTVNRVRGGASRRRHSLEDRTREQLYLLTRRRHGGARSTVGRTG